MTTRSMLRRRAAHMRLTAAGTLLACLATGCSLQPNENTLPGQVATGSDGYGVTVRFEAVENLVPNSQVLLDDVVVGTVTAIRVDDWHAVADLRLLDSVPISDRARFTIGQKTLLGAQYVDIDSPRVDAAASPVGLLGDGDEVPLSRTGQAPGTEQVLAGVALLLNNGGLSQISTITSELTTAFQIGFLLFIPFVVIDLVVSSVLMSLGMMMLSPMLISLPFKLMLFVLVDGWSLTMSMLAASFKAAGA